MLRKLLLLFLLTLLGWQTKALGQTVTVDGVKYGIQGSTASVESYQDVSGSVEIRSSITYNGKSYSVTSIADHAFYNCTGMTSITIPNTIKRILDHAFFHCTGLTSVSIPNSVTTIGYQAFSYCSGLTSVAIPNSVTSLGALAFNECTGLISITIPNSITSIEHETFSNCSALASVNIPNSVTEIGTDAFINCTSLVKAEFTSIENLCSINFVNSNSNPLSFAKHLYINGGEITKVEIPNSVIKIGNFAFSSAGSISSVTIPNSVTLIGIDAFSRCSGLTEISIPNSVHTIGCGAFKSCAKLTKVVIEDGKEALSLEYKANEEIFNNCNIKSVYLGRNLKSSDNYAPFKYQTQLKELTIGKNVTSIGDYAFAGCSGLASVLIPASVTQIGTSAFENINKLTELSLSNSVKTIGSKAFSGCTGLTEVILPSSVTSVGTGAFSGCTKLVKSAYPSTISTNPFPTGISIQYPAKGAIIENRYIWGPNNSAIYYVPTDYKGVFAIPSTVQVIGSLAFGACKDITSVTMPESVSKIGSKAFSECVTLSNITIPESVYSIGQEAFSGCSGLSTVYFKAKDLTECGKNIFPATTSTLDIDNSVTFDNIPSDAFANLNLKSLYIGAGILKIKSDCFSKNIVKIFWLGNTPPVGWEKMSASVHVVANNQYSDSDSSLYPDKNIVTYQFLSSRFAVNGIWYVPTNVSERKCDVIDCDYSAEYKNVTVPETVTYKNISFSVENISDYSFYHDNNVKTLSINSSGSIRDFAFSGLTKPTSVNLNGKITEIRNGAFKDCNSLKELNIPNTVKSIGDYAFGECTSVTTLTFNEEGKSLETSSVLALGSNGNYGLFTDCPLIELYIGRKLSYSPEYERGYSPFCHITTLTKAEISNAELQVLDNEFYLCSG